MLPIILASASLRRNELLKTLKIDFEVLPSQIDEDMSKLTGDYVEKAEALALMKALDVAKKISKGIVIGADTLVVLDNKLFGKPTSSNDAYYMLKCLSNRTHSVVTGVALIDAGNEKTRVGNSITDVKFCCLSDEIIEAYIKTGEPFGKAGGYAIQERGALLVESIKGCYFNVVGLPLFKLSTMLLDFGVRLL